MLQILIERMHHLDSLGPVEHTPNLLGQACSPRPTTAMAWGLSCVPNSVWTGPA